MNLKITNKEAFLDNFLIPVSKVVENAILKIEPGKISTLTASSDSTIVTYSEYRDISIVDTLKLNLPDVKKFVKLLSCIESDIDLVIDTNNLSYKSPGVRFKYHLYDEGIISSPNVNLDKLSKLEFDGEFSVSYDNINKLIKGSSFTENNEKVYLTFSGDNLVDAEVTDKSKHNTNSFGTTIADNYVGPKNGLSFPLKFDILQHISQYRADIYNVKVVTKLGVFVFTVDSENVLTKFIVSALKN
jgi:hypothetical protein